MRTYEESSEPKQKEIDTLVKYANIVRNSYEAEKVPKEEIRENVGKLREVVKNKILKILDY